LEALGLALCLYLFFSFKSEQRKAALRAGARQDAIEDAVEQLRAALEKLRLEMTQSENRFAAAPGPALPQAALNISKRSRALRMSRRGEAAEQIAAALALPQREVELLLKVENLVVKD